MTGISEIVDFGLRGSPGRILDQVWEVFAQLPRGSRADPHDPPVVPALRLRMTLEVMKYLGHLDLENW